MTQKTKAAAFASDTYNIHVTGRNVMVTDAMKNHAMDKISKVEKFTDRIIHVVVTMDIQKIEHRVDIVMHVGHLHIKSHAVTEDMYASIDQAVKKIERQLVRYKKRMQDHHARPLESIDMQVNVLRAPSERELDEINDAIEEETVRKIEQNYGIHQVVSQKTLPMKFLSQTEAVMKMDLSGDSFLVYCDEEQRKVKIIYRREDGNYGVISPEIG